MNEQINTDDLSNILECLTASSQPLSKAELSSGTKIDDKNYLHRLIVHLQKRQSIKVFITKDESGENVTVYSINSDSRTFSQQINEQGDNCLIAAVMLDESNKVGVDDRTSELVATKVGGENKSAEHHTDSTLEVVRSRSVRESSESPSTRSSLAPSPTDLAELVRARVTGLRPKLLDLSRRNPLIAPKLGPRSNSHIQVVDELPTVLFENLAAERKMRFRALPSLEEDLKDEGSVIFQDALTQERAVDDDYQTAVEALEHESEDDEKYRELERKLKDKVRDKLGMDPRQTKSDVSLPQHAKNHGISPNYELPLPAETHEDGRHTDKDIQTLLLPDALDRKLSKIISTCNSWTQETGIHVLYAAFGFLEWKDPKSGENIFAPLILLPVTVEKTRSRAGTEFWVRGEEEQGELNTVLQEKLKQDFGIKLDDLDFSDLEKFFDSVNSLAPVSISWKVRRQVVFGVFPSARIAMYHDLDSSKHDFAQNNAITSLLAGSAWGGAAMFGDDYCMDDPDIEKKVPCLVMDADSSQVSTIVDVMDGKHLAVEGPPGTGKSQTIVNTIAAALNENKKVLFVAEKSAALDVVKARLEQIGLGHFILALQANKASRERVIESIAARLNLPNERISNDLEKIIHRFRESRAEIRSYLDVICSDFGSTGFKVFEIMGKAIKTNEILLDTSDRIQKPEFQNIEDFNQLKIEKCLMLCESLSKAWLSTQNSLSHWKSVTVVDLDKFAAEQICDAANVFSVRLAELFAASDKLRSLMISTSSNLQALLKTLEKGQSLLPTIDIALTLKLYPADDLSAIREFIVQLKKYDSLDNALKTKTGSAPEKIEISYLEELLALLNATGKRDCSVATLTQLKENLEAQREVIEDQIAILKPLSEIHPQSKNWSLKATAKLKSVISLANKRVLQARKKFDPEEVQPEEVLGLARKGNGLVLRYKDFSAQFILSRLKSSADEIADASGTFKSSNWLSIFDARFKSAKSFYLQISKAAKFEKAEAIRALDELVEWKEEFEQFCRDKKVISLFGRDVDIEYDFDTFEELGSYLIEVYEQFDSVKEKSIQEFLLNATKEQLGCVPQLSVESISNETSGELEAKLLQIVSELTPLRDVVIYYQDNFEQNGVVSKLNADGVHETIEKIREFLDVGASLDDNAGVQEILGECFRGKNSDADLLSKCLAFVEIIKPAALDVETLSTYIADGSFSPLIGGLVDYAKRESEADIAAVQLSRITGVPEKELRERKKERSAIQEMKESAADTDGLFAFASLRTSLRDLNEAGVGWVAQELIDADKPLSNLPRIAESAIYAAMTRRIYADYSRILAKYSGRKLDECRESVARYDREIISLSREKLKAQLRASALPPDGITQGRKSELTEMALLKNELGKKRGFISVRELTKRAAKALLEIKPCWMMSPLAVAQYLQAGEAPFDLVIIDEASQMPPENALGALVRAKQAVVVGDTNQLPPTNFFQKAFADEDLDEDEAVLEESVLELANSAFRPARRLKWHYRSRHSALINFSNQMIYNGDLIVFPGPNERKNDFGVSLREVEGYFKSGLNEREADAIVSATLDFMRNYPDRSLGIVVLNRKQCDFLREKFDHALNQDVVAAEYVDRWQKRNDGIESFFVKNLENVQGDERDAIFIGTVYGPSEPGAKTANRFGPINGIAGKRRLNVLFSRAKLQIVTFTSMKSTEITAEEERNAGAHMLKKWLEYCASGGEVRSLQVQNFSDSEFEDYVIQQVRSMGYEAFPQVGASGYFIDIGVKHPDFPDEFILGIECDGATYHSSNSARERDRLRQEVLEGLGWAFHRIWSTDWFNDPRREASILRDILSARINMLSERKTLRSPRL